MKRQWLLAFVCCFICLAAGVSRAAAVVYDQVPGPFSGLVGSNAEGVGRVAADNGGLGSAAGMHAPERVDPIRETDAAFQLIAPAVAPPTGMVPEPGALALLGLGIAVLAVLWHMRK